MDDISKLEQQADLLFNNVAGWESSTLQRIGKRIGKYGKMSLADVKVINNIAVVKSDMDAITKELAKVTGYNISQIEQMYGELLEEQHLANQPLYDYRGKTFVPFKDNRELQAIAKAYARTTAGNMVNLSQIGGSHLGFIDKNGKFKAIEKMYTEALDKAVMQVSTGATDFHTAMRDTIVEMGGSGIRINYADSGITRRLDTAVRQSLLWGAKQASIEYNEMIGKELGCDGYEVDYHSNPRPSHEFMQGKQFVVGKARTINGIHFDSFDEAEKALNEYGCLHYKTPIICGISEPRYSEKELARLKEQDKKTYEIDGKQVTGYEATQMQRRLETAVRNEKSIKNMAQAEGNKKLVSDCNAKIKAYQGKYNEISEITGIQGDKKRMSVPRGTSSVKGAIKEKASKIEFSENLKNALGEVSKTDMVKYLENAPEDIRTVWNKYEEKLKVIDANFKGTAHYDTKQRGVLVNGGFATKTSEIAGRTPYSQIFHELGHNIDAVASEPLSTYSFQKGRCRIGDAFKSEKHLKEDGSGFTLTEMLNQEIDEWFNSVKGGMGKNARAVNVWGKISDDMQQIPWQERVTISDIISSRSQGMAMGGYGHGQKYWSETTVGVEAFAEMFGDSVCNPEQMAMTRKHFPKSCEIFEEIIKHIGG